MKRPARAWIVAAVLLAAWVAAGFFFDTSPHLGWLPKWALTASVLAPLAWIAIYTIQGLAGHGKWWQSDLGTNMVWLELAVIFTNGMIGWAAFFNHGELNTPIQAWCYIGGILAGIAVITWRSVIWLRVGRREPPLLARVHELENEVTTLRAQLAGPGASHTP
jgi:hypothetical protein